jgi:hypothetical protein
MRHGMLTGLTLMLAVASVPPAAAPQPDGPFSALPHDRELVRLLANMLLRTQSEVVHVY